jgi:hypothetical protein
MIAQAVGQVRAGHRLPEEEYLHVIAVEVRQYAHDVCVFEALRDARRLEIMNELTDADAGLRGCRPRGRLQYAFCARK